MIIPRAIIAIMIIASAPATAWGEDSYSYRRVRVEHNIEDKEYVKAIARIVDFAASKALEYGYDMPDQFLVNVHLDPGQRVSLSTTGDYQISLKVQKMNQLLAPAKCGVNNVYGFCHEVGHVCQYRIMKSRQWMTTGACEGWAHYYGAFVLDHLYKKYGKEIWPDPHDYSVKGLKRTLNDMKGSKEEIHQGAYHWSRLADIVGEKGIPEIFHALNGADIDAFNAAEDVEEVLKKQKKGSKLVKWWKDAKGVMVAELGKSDFETETVKKSKLSGKPKLLAHDEGEPTGQISWPGSSGAAVFFEAGGKSYYLTEVHVYGERYGRKVKENFFIWLLDDEFKAIKRFPIPYDDFAFGNPHWEKFDVEPTLVPREFFICVVYNAESQKGVYRFHDGSSGGNSFSGKPGESARGSNDGDWLIRAVVKKKK